MISNFALCLIPTTIFVLLGIRKLRERSWGWCKNNIKLDNKVAVITGANCGIGFEIAKDLAARNATVILACRNMDLAKKAIRKIEEQFKNKLQLTAMELDLGSLKSIKLFATNLQKIHPEINILINNAGVAYPKNQIHQTSDGFEIHFGVNYLGHFYLTNLLLDSLKRSKLSRIIVVSSSLHEKGKIDFENLNVRTPFYKMNLYANSKLANVYFARELAKKNGSNGPNVYAVCPGWVYTSLFRYSFKWFHYIIIAPIAFFFMRSAKQGSQTPIYCATEPKLANETGLLYRNCGPYKSKVTFDDDLSLKLWNETERLIHEKM